MKSFLLSIALVNSLFSFDYKLQPKEVSEDIHCFFGAAEVMNKHNNGNMSNSCFITIGESYLVIDSGPTYQYAQQAYRAMKNVKDLPISYVLNTHIHDDHWLGNSYYKQEGISIVGSDAFETLPKEQMTRMQKRISQEAFRGTTQQYPDLFVHGKKVLEVDGQKILLYSVNAKAHTKDDLYVYIPSKSALFAGDLVFNGRLPSLRDGNIHGWIAALQRIKLMPNLRYIIGGHGEIITPKAVDFTYNYLKTLEQEVQKALDNDLDIDDAVNTVVMPAYKSWPFYDSIHRQNVEQVYRTLEWESE